jgi:chromate reductase
MFIFMDGNLLNKPEVMISGAMSKFDADGKLTDEPTRQIIAAQLVALKAWTLQLRR